MRKIFFYEKDDVSQVENFFSDTDEKIRSKLKFQLAYLQDEVNQFKEPHVKSFSMEKYSTKQKHIVHLCRCGKIKSV